MAAAAGVEMKTLPVKHTTRTLLIFLRVLSQERLSLTIMCETMMCDRVGPSHNHERLARQPRPTQRE